MQVGKGLINAEIISDAYSTMLGKGGKFQGGGGGAKTHSEKMKLWSEMGKK